VSGHYSSPYRTGRRGEINGDVVDRFTLAHGAAGAVAGAIAVPFWAALLIAVGWEIVERPLKRSIPSAFPHATQDTLGNMTGDVLGFMAGWWAARAVRRSL